MTSENISYRVENGAAWVTLNRPEKSNALDRAMMEDLAAMLMRAESRDEVRLLVLTGAGDVFCAGGDLSEFLDRSPADQRRAVEAFARLMTIPQAVGKPVIAAVNGLTLGGGCGLVAACDLAIAVESARFGLPELRVGLFPFLAMPHLLRTIGQRHFLKLALTGELVSAHEAKSLGLVDWVVPVERLTDSVQEVAQRIRGYSPVLLRMGKEALRGVMTAGLPAALQGLKEALMMALATEDARERMRAFVERRPPIWKER
ncbi:MAG: enoyl-CoA hydratase/isomerase family protein [Armatimonadota bacterium]|nr:enoyl-CoA hydratase/isomerase family protein [Armatimonadota bacterium]MDR7469484.1 enoyl-CoA hydratase/isomerase family protein [Armatimonadota bacterium]MDR7475435.1 enoyl-CoA hydratase/isomerase family protein [Armatimonadota bacterium]